MSDCSLDPRTYDDCLGDAAEGAVDKVAGDALEQLREAVVEGFGQVVGSLGTLWVQVPAGNVLSGGRATSVDYDRSLNSPELDQILGNVMWIGLVVAAVALIFLLAQIGAATRRGEGVAAVGRIGVVLGAVVLIGGASSVVAFVMGQVRPNADGAVLFLQSALWPYMAAGAVVAVLVAAIRMAWEQRAQPGRDLVRGLITLVVVAGAGVTIIQTLVAISDQFSIWILRESLECKGGDTNCFGQELLELIALGNSAPGPALGMGTMLVIVLGLIALIVSLIQVVLMVARTGMLVVLAGVLPLAASASSTEIGQTWFKRMVGWLVAFILYKPAAAIIYAAAFQLVAGNDLFGDDDSRLVPALAGIMMMGMALVALPALMRFVMPMVAAASGNGGLPDAPPVEAPTGARPSSSSGSPGPTGAPGSAGQRGTPGSQGLQGPTGNAAPTSGAGGGVAGGMRGLPAAGPASGGAAGGTAAAGGAAGGGAAGGASVGAGAAAGAAAGPVGAAVGAAAAVAAAGAQAAKSATERVTGEATGEEGPSGSR